MNATSDRVWTIPNVISMIRIALIGVFAWLFVSEHDAWAIATLAVTGASDFLDGYLARRLNQQTRLGALLDPAADRLLTFTIVVTFAARGIIPLWLLIALLARDVVMALALVVAKRAKVSPPEVTYTGKAATFGLYLWLPLAYIGFLVNDGTMIVGLIGASLSALMYWWSAGEYISDIRRRIRDISG